MGSEAIAALLDGMFPSERSKLSLELVKTTLARQALEMQQ
ncbi:hypothetical protein NBRC116492_33650 [Aurantivibrio infirmus]